MPSYDYFCESNNQVVEVKHAISEKLATWGEVCERAGIDPGKTPANTPVERLATGGQLVRSSSMGSGSGHSCGSGGCGSCSFN